MLKKEADNSKKINLKKEIRYKLCTCGASNNIPFCDDSHRELNKKIKSNYKSLKITPEEDIELKVSCKNWKENKSK